MTTIEFGTKAAADSIRDEFTDHLCSDDDRRLRTVTFASDTPDHVLDQARLEAEDSRGEQTSGPGQVPLTDDERDRIDFSKGRANVLHARSVKGIAADAGVSDWTAYYDPTLTTDEHREVMDRAAKEGGGSTQDTQDSTVERAARAAQTTKGGQCDHARDHCEHGDPEACEFLTETCGYSEEEVSAFLDDTGEETTEQTGLVTVGGGKFPEMDVRPEVAGALSRSWQGYRSGVRRVERELQDLREEVINARQAMQAINSIRERHDQEELHPDRLHDLLEALESMPESIPELRTLDHYREFSEGGEQVIEQDEQRDLAGDRANDQARLAGGEQGERGQGEVEEHVEENPGGLMADQRDDTSSGPTGEGTEQQVPDEFQVAEGGQDTL